MPDLKIGELARRTGTNAPTVRYYEQIGLLPPASRRDGGQRRYGGADVRRLTFIRRCRDFGFSIEQVQALTTLVQDRGVPARKHGIWRRAGWQRCAPSWTSCRRWKE